MTEFDSTFAVVAHGLLNSLATISMTLGTSSDQRLSSAQRASMVDAARRQTDHVIGVLRDLIAGVPPEIINALDRLSVRGEVGISGELLGPL